MTSCRLTLRNEKDTAPCLWMQAGVVRRKECRLNFHCTACRFDKALMHAAERHRKARRQGIRPPHHGIVYWQDKLLERSIAQRPCLHHMKGRIEFKNCTMEYQCGKCEFDQYFNDQYTVHAVVRPIDVLNIDGFRIPQGYYLHRGHAWLKLEENNEVRIGVDDFILRLLGPLDELRPPLMGKKVRQDDPDFHLMRGDLAAQVLSPVSGVVTAVNTRLMEDGAGGNTDPYSDGWLIRVHADHLRQDLKKLMIGPETQDFLKAEVDRLYDFIEAETGPLAADGGELGFGIVDHLPKNVWNRLTQRFLRS